MRYVVSLFFAVVLVGSAHAQSDRDTWAAHDAANGIDWTHHFADPMPPEYAAPLPSEQQDHSPYMVDGPTGTHWCHPGVNLVMCW